MATKSSAPEGTGLRERKKWETRSAIASMARSLFAERGFDAVTVAEIADAAAVSVKTLFKYFASKEDLFFEDFERDFREQLLQSVQSRGPGQSAFDALTARLETLLFSTGGDDVLASVELFRKTLAANPSLLGRLALMWERCEDALAHWLSSETGAAPNDLRPRLAAAQMVGLVRVFTSEELRRSARARPAKARRQELERTVREAFQQLGDGLRHYAARKR
jgi:AcrR family transcriptional regulator